MTDGLGVRRCDRCGQEHEEWQRCPFLPGGEASLRHGGYATVHLRPRAEQLAAELRALAPVYSPADEPVVRLLALVLARIETATTALDEVDEKLGERAAEGEYLGASADVMQRLRADLRGWINTARRLANDLGMTPTSRVRLGLDVARTRAVAEGLEELRERGRQAIDTRADDGGGGDV